jgi:hypothetical protein
LPGFHAVTLDVILLQTISTTIDVFLYNNLTLFFSLNISVIWTLSDRFSSFIKYTDGLTSDKNFNLVYSLLSCSGQNKRIAPLSFNPKDTDMYMHTKLYCPRI